MMIHSLQQTEHDDFPVVIENEVFTLLGVCQFYLYAWNVKFSIYLYKILKNFQNLWICTRDSVL